MALVAMGLGVFVIANDFTALNVALPAIEGDLDADVGSVQWVINAYALVFGMAIVSGGRLADMFGRRRIFFIGSILFAAFSAVGALAPDLGVLIARPGRDGGRRRADVAGDPRHDLRRAAGVEGRARRRPDPRRRRDRQRDRPAARRRPHRGPRAGAGSSSSTSRSPLFAMFVTWRKVHQPQELSERADRLRRDGDDLRRPRAPARSPSTRPSTGAGPTRGWSRCSSLSVVLIVSFAVDRAAGRRARPDPARRDRQQAASAPPA